MKTILVATFLMLVSVACVKSNKSSEPESAGEKKKSKYSVEIKSLSAIIPTGVATPTKLTLEGDDCPTVAAKTYNIDGSGSIPDLWVVDISDCTPVLAEFTIGSNAYVPSTNPEEKREINGQVDAIYYDNGDGDYVLVRDPMVTMIDCILPLIGNAIECADVYSYLVTFYYSDIVKKEGPILIENFEVSKVSVELIQEPAPECSLSAKFIYNSSDPTIPPSLELTLTDTSTSPKKCDLGSMEIGLLKSDGTDVYHVLDLHDLISDDLHDDSNGNGIFTYTYEDLKEITGIDSTDAYLEDLVLAIRQDNDNETGISIAYFVLENNCVIAAEQE